MVEINDVVALALFYRFHEEIGFTVELDLSNFTFENYDSPESFLQKVDTSNPQKVLLFCSRTRDIAEFALSAASSIQLIFNDDSVEPHDSIFLLTNDTCVQLAAEQTLVPGTPFPIRNVKQIVYF